MYALTFCNSEGFHAPLLFQAELCDQGLSPGPSGLSLTDFRWNPSPFLENHPGKGGEVLLSPSL